MGAPSRLNPQVRIQLLARLIRRAAAGVVCVIPCWYAIEAAGAPWAHIMAGVQVLACLFGALVAVQLHALAERGETRLIRALKDSGHFQFLVLESICCVALFTAAAVLSIAVRLLDNQPYIVWLATAAVYFGLVGIVFLVAVSIKHYRVLTIIQD